jgi:lysylphosphatidylglycerol synthetase-like protein (DUF2156 family)
MKLRRRIDSWLDRPRHAVSESAPTLEQRRLLLRSHGNFSLAFATSEFGHAEAFGDERGYVGYGQKMGFVFALGDPVCDAAEKPDLLERFITHFGNPTFAQVAEPTAALLAQRGYRVTQFGVDTVLPLAEYSLAGKEKEGIRYAANRLRKRGYRFEERQWSAETLALLADISREWIGELAYRARKMRFLNRSLPTEPQGDARVILLLDPAGRAVGFVVFDPIYEHGRTIGYVCALRRRLHVAGAYAEMALLHHAINLFKSEGRHVLRLGLSPFLVEGRSPFRDNAALRRLFGFLVGSQWINRSFFNLAGQIEFKRRFHGREEPLYLATRGGMGMSLVKLLALLRLSKIV